MTAPRCFPGLTLHVFEQDGGWQWGLTMPRQRGAGVKVIAFSNQAFNSEIDARRDGERGLIEELKKVPDNKAA